MAMLAEHVDGVIGVDTHRDTLAAAAVTRLGGVLAQTTTSADATGYQRLLDFAHAHLPAVAAGRSRGRGVSAPALPGSCNSTASGSSRSVDPSGQPVAAAPRATPWTRSGPPARRLARTTWRPHGVGVSGRPCACC
jgi:hypothetical protein